jgi:conjugal transfer/entry exclusion protein
MKNNLKEQDATILNSLGDENQINNKIKLIANQVSETINLINNTFNTFMNSSMIELLENNNQKLKQLNDKADNLDDILSNIQSKIMKFQDSINEITDDNENLSQEQKNYYDKKLTDLANLYKISNNKTTAIKLDALTKLTYKISSTIEFEVEDDGAFQNLISKM